MRAKLDEWESKEVWRAVFRNTPEEGPVLDQFLKERLRDPHTHYLGHHLVLTVMSPTKDDAFKCGEWVRHQNPLGRLLDYTVIGYDGGRVKYLSACRICRKGNSGPHHEHAKGG